MSLPLLVQRKPLLELAQPGSCFGQAHSVISLPSCRIFCGALCEMNRLRSTAGRTASVALWPDRLSPHYGSWANVVPAWKPAVPTKALRIALRRRCRWRNDGKVIAVIRTCVQKIHLLPASNRRAGLALELQRSPSGEGRTPFEMGLNRMLADLVQERQPHGERQFLSPLACVEQCYHSQSTGYSSIISNRSIAGLRRGLRRNRPGML